MKSNMMGLGRWPPTLLLASCALDGTAKKWRTVVRLSMGAARSAQRHGTAGTANFTVVDDTSRVPRRETDRQSGTLRLR
jgi:hypothetical protein